MEKELIAPVRSFNRTVTQRIGALYDEYLSRDRPLGASRVLWEINAGIDVRSIRERLDLDAGYLSRLLRQLESENLVRVRPAPYDHRVRFVELTKLGRGERAELDRRSDELAWSMLEPLNDEQREHLIEAMATVEKLLTEALVDIRVEDPESRAALYCMNAYYAELDTRFEAGFHPELSLTVGGDDLREPSGLLLVAFLRNEPVGCGAIVFASETLATLKRMWVAQEARGLGIGRRILAELENRARSRGTKSLRLDTNRRLEEAINLYQTSGFHEVGAFNTEQYAHHWFEKPLSKSAPSPRKSAKGKRK
jgi:DNA-binding MarR family transcriptional regulator/predicted GNAT family N-acyltransferase